MPTSAAQPQRVEDVDIFDAATMEDWYPTYDLLREAAPVYRVPGTNTYFLTRYEDVQHVLRRTDIFRRGAGEDAPLIANKEALARYEGEGWPRVLPLASDPPIHRRYRDLVDPFFSVAGAAKRRPLIAGIVDELIDSWVGDGEVEYVTQFALPLPVRVITRLIGFPASDIPQLKEWSEAWVRPFAGGLSAADEAWCVEKHLEFQHYIHGHIEKKRLEPEDDVLSHLVSCTFEDPAGPRPLTDGEIINIADHLYIGGNETTTFALTSGMWLLVNNPDVEAALRQDPSRVRTFVDEVVRLESPTQGLHRHVEEDTEIRGVPIPKGSSVHLRYAAANRDGRQFACPADVDLERSNGHRHVGFSLGETHCPGAGLSRLEQTVAMETMLQRLGAVRFAPGRNDFRHQRNFTLRAMNELHLEFDAKA